MHVILIMYMHGIFPSAVEYPYYYMHSIVNQGHLSNQEDWKNLLLMTVLPNSHFEKAAKRFGWWGLSWAEAIANIGAIEEPDASQLKLMLKLK